MNIVYLYSYFIAINLYFIGSTKKAAKKECCIAAIKYFWKFDFHAIEV